MADFARAWCPDCKRWVPADKMNYFSGIRVCQWCMEGIESPEDLVHDPHHEEIQCIYCDSYNTVEVIGKPGCYKCLECDDTFYI